MTAEERKLKKRRDALDAEAEREGLSIEHLDELLDAPRRMKEVDRRILRGKQRVAPAIPD